MCGLVGFVGAGAERNRERIERMRQVICHRGPSHMGLHVRPHACVGFNRLAINDLSERGNQPFHHDGVTVFCNGEIYNHKELRRRFDLEGLCRSRSDIEIVPHLYRRFGLDFLHHLNGMFAMLILDERQGVTHLITDRFGKKPLYVAERDGGVFFGSELKVFLREFDCPIDKTALNTGFFLGYFPQPTTPVQGVRKVPPATILTIRPGGTDERVWYVLAPRYDLERASDADLHDLYYEILDDAVKVRLEADVETGFYLSGGLDSTTIAESARRQRGPDLHAFTGLIEGKEYSTDNVNAMRFAAEQQLVLHPVELSSGVYDELLIPSCHVFDEVPFETGNINFLTIAREAVKFVTVLLDGVGGDEAFIGYPHQLVLHQRMPAALRNVLPLSPSLLRLAGTLHRRAESAVLVMMDVRRWFFIQRAFVPIPMMRRSPFFDLGHLHGLLDTMIPRYASGFRDQGDINLASYLDILGYNMLNYQHSDRGSMAYSIENRSPLSDYRLWEAFLGVSVGRKLNGGLKGLYRRLSDRLPDYIRNAPKDGFSSPVYLWLRADTGLRSAMTGYVRRQRDALAELIGDGVVGAILDPWTDAGAGGAEWMDGIRLHSLVCLGLWHELYFERTLSPTDAPTFRTWSRG